VRVGARETTLDTATGAVVVDGLPAGRELPILLDGRLVGSVRTLEPPPGRLLGRIATVSDLHIGEQAIGRLPRIHSSNDDELAHPLMCLRAALAEAVEWGADRVLVKGDVTDESAPRPLTLALDALGAAGKPVHVVAGNHDHHPSQPSPAAAMAAQGAHVAAPVLSLDVPGLRIILADTAKAGVNAGAVAEWATEVLDLAAEASGAVLLAVHHQFMHLPVQTYVPAGIARRDSAPFLAALAAANPATLVTSGHTHRHRRRDWGPIVTTEVGSTKDYPGTWAGYLVYEGGIVQTVRRIMDPAVIAWTERTRLTALGLWGLWSPGRLADRSFTHRWAKTDRRLVRVSHLLRNLPAERPVPAAALVGPTTSV
jgi:predicted phosphodiesterase